MRGYLRPSLTYFTSAVIFIATIKIQVFADDGPDQMNIWPNCLHNSGPALQAQIYTACFYGSKGQKVATSWNIPGE